MKGSIHSRSILCYRYMSKNEEFNSIYVREKSLILCKQSLYVTNCFEICLLKIDSVEIKSYAGGGGRIIGPSKSQLSSSESLSPPASQ